VERGEARHLALTDLNMLSRSSETETDFRQAHVFPNHGGVK
jgi:hypothetical protein